MTVGVNAVTMEVKRAHAHSHFPITHLLPRKKVPAARSLAEPRVVPPVVQAVLQAVPHVVHREACCC